MNTLYLLIDERWPEDLVAEWVLVERRGDVVEQGRSDPAHWPVADRRIAILAGAQVSVTTVALPKHRRADRDRLIAYALEERLPADAESQHFTLMNRKGDLATIAIVDADRLRRIVDAAASFNHALDACYGRLQSIDSRDHVAVCQEEYGMRYWRWPDGSGMVDDVGESGASPLVIKMLERTAAQSVSGSPEVAKSVGLPLESGLEELPVVWYRVRAAKNLLHGDFSNQQTGMETLERLRWPLRIMLVAIVFHLALGAGSAIFDRYTLNKLHRQTEAIFAATFPGAAIVDPVLQMRRQLNEQRGLNGLIRDDDFLSLMAPLADAFGAEGRGAITRIRFAAESIEIATPVLTDAERRQALIDALAMRGLSGRMATGRGDVLLITRGIQ